MKPTYSPHGRVVGYDGAFWCLDCKAKWGALPGNPSMPAVCVKPAQDGTPRTDAADDVTMRFSERFHRLRQLAFTLERELRAQAKRIEELDLALMWAKRSKDGYRALLNMPSEPRDDTIRELERAVQREHLRAEQAERNRADFYDKLQATDAYLAETTRQCKIFVEAGYDATQRAEQSEALVEQLQGALRELVRLKDLRERADEVFTPDVDPGADIIWHQCMDEYERCKPAAWEAARALSGHAHAQTTTNREDT